MGTKKPPKVSQGRPLAPEREAENMTTSEAMSIAELLMADPLTRGGAVSRQPLARQLRVPDLVNDARGSKRSADHSDKAGDGE
jgi:hypothetical protein